MTASGPRRCRRAILIGGFLLLGRSSSPAQTLTLWDDFDLLPRARMALMYATSVAGFAANIEILTAESLEDGRFGRKILAKGLTLKREEALATTAKYYGSNRSYLLQSLAEMQDAIERAARPGTLEADNVGYRLSELGRAAIEKRKPSASDFKRQERPVAEDKQDEGVQLKSGNLEFKP